MSKKRLINIIFSNKEVSYSLYKNLIKNLDALKASSSITAGAYWGDSALIFAGIYQSTTFAFEPNAISFLELQDTVAHNNLHSLIIPIQKGISNENNTLFFDYSGYNTASKFIAEKDIIDITKVEKLEVVAIDNFVKEKNIAKLGAIHLDIEGFETDAILGAKNTITRDKPILLISIYHNTQDFFKIKPIIESWNLGYTFKIRKLERIRNEIMLIVYVP